MKAGACKGLKEDSSSGCGGIDVIGDGGGRTNAVGTIREEPALDAAKVLGITSVSIGGMILGFAVDAPRETPCGFLDKLPRPFLTLPTANAGFAGDRQCAEAEPAFVESFFGDLNFLVFRADR